MSIVDELAAKSGELLRSDVATADLLHRAAEAICQAEVEHQRLLALVRESQDCLVAMQQQALLL